MCAPGARSSSVCGRISAHRYLRPGSIALTDGAQALSYEHLDRRAEQFAAYLLQAGVRPGSTVALCFKRSFEWVIASWWLPK